VRLQAAQPDAQCTAHSCIALTCSPPQLSISALDSVAADDSRSCLLSAAWHKDLTKPTISALGIEEDGLGGHEADDDHEVAARRGPRHVVDRPLLQARQALARAVRGLLAGNAFCFRTGCQPDESLALISTRLLPGLPAATLSHVSR